MNRQIAALALALLLAAGSASPSLAGGQTRKYQVTGPITKVEADKVTVQKGDESWEIATDKDTKITGDLKVGAKVTIEYQMFATAVTVKEAKETPAKEAAKTK